MASGTTERAMGVVFCILLASVSFVAFLLREMAPFMELFFRNGDVLLSKIYIQVLNNIAGYPHSKGT